MADSDGLCSHRKPSSCGSSWFISRCLSPFGCLGIEPATLLVLTVDSLLSNTCARVHTHTHTHVCSGMLVETLLLLSHTFSFAISGVIFTMGFMSTVTVDSLRLVQAVKKNKWRLHWLRRMIVPKVWEVQHTFLVLLWKFTVFYAKWEKKQVANRCSKNTAGKNVIFFCLLG